MTFANFKTIKTKHVIKKELIKKKLITINSEYNFNDQQACAFLVYVREWDGEQWGPTEIQCIIDWECIKRQLPPGFFI